MIYSNVLLVINTAAITVVNVTFLLNMSHWKDFCANIYKKKRFKLKNPRLLFADYLWRNVIGKDTLRTFPFLGEKSYTNEVYRGY